MIAVLEGQWLTIYRETVHPLYAYTAKRTGGNRALTEDIVQETYLRALESWGLKAAPDSPLAWLKRVARNILIDFLRRKGRPHAAPGKADPAAPHPTGGGHFESLEMFWAISSLGPKKARILEAFYYDGKSVREIAQETASSEKAVEGLLRRARQSLKSRLPDLKSDGGKNGQCL
jgi:RNA polymerase sigma-70 factor (ECF subfamily)